MNVQIWSQSSEQVSVRCFAGAAVQPQALSATCSLTRFTRQNHLHGWSSKKATTKTKPKTDKSSEKHKKNVHRPALSVKIYLMSPAIISCASSDYLAYECVATVVALTFTTYHALPDNTHGWSSLLSYNRSLLLLHVFSCDQGWAGMFFLGSQEWE